MRLLRGRGGQDAGRGLGAPPGQPAIPTRRAGWSGWCRTSSPRCGSRATLERSGEGLYDRMNGVGAHEVVIEAPAHDAGSDRPAGGRTCRGAARLSRARCCDLAKDPRFEYVLVFKNHGDPAGARLEHTHTQLIATPIIPEHGRGGAGGREPALFELKERCVFCDIVQQERRDTAARVIARGERFVAIAPFAPRFPFETWILPSRHRRVFEATPGPTSCRDLARAARRCVRRVTRALERPAVQLHDAHRAAARRRLSSTSTGTSRSSRSSPASRGSSGGPGSSSTRRRRRTRRSTSAARCRMSRKLTLCNAFVNIRDCIAHAGAGIAQW